MASQCLCLVSEKVRSGKLRVDFPSCFPGKFSFSVLSQRVSLSDLRVLVVISWGPAGRFGKGGHKDQVAVEHHVYHWAPIMLSDQKSTE